jgi:small conductance mechanosensitive channel
LLYIETTKTMDYLILELQKILYKIEKVLYKNFRIDNETLIEIILVGLLAIIFSKISSYIFERLAAKAIDNKKQNDLYEFLRDSISFFFLAIFLLVAGNEIPIIAKKYLSALEIVLVAMFIHKLAKFYINKRLDTLDDKNDKTKLSFLQNTLDLLVFIVASFAVISSIPQFRAFALTLFASAGIFAAFIGLASQKAFANLVSGIFIVVFKPFRVGDVVEVDGHTGEVKDITLRHTRILNYENRSVIIPNANIDSLVIKNSSFPENKVCRYVEVSISYDANIEQAMQIVEQLALQHPYCIDQRTEDEKRRGVPQVRLRTLRLNEYGVLLRANIWAKNADDAYDLHCDLNKSIKERFEQEGIEIPYPHRVLVIKNKDNKIV